MHKPGNAQEQLFDSFTHFQGLQADNINYIFAPVKGPLSLLCPTRRLWDAATQH